MPADLLGGQADQYPSIAGRVTFVDGAVCFTARYPFVPGLRYAVLVRSPSEGLRPPLFIARPATNAEPVGRIIEIYPTAAELPRNHLRFYIQFSEPMSEGFAASAIELRRADSDDVIPDAFLAGPELWDRLRRRLTLLLDPGRIKRGLVPNAETGYPLTEGLAVALTVSPDLPDAEGRPLLAGGRREYQVGPDVRARVDPGQWTIVPPPAGSDEPLVVALDRPLDHALLTHCVHVLDELGQAVRGRSMTARDDRQWAFRPDSPWRPGRYQVLVESHLEDSAGNSAARLFDRDLDAARDDPGSADPVTLGFRCR